MGIDQREHGQCGALSWTVTGPATAQARIRATSVTDPTVADSSNANAAIQ